MIEIINNTLRLNSSDEEETLIVVQANEKPVPEEDHPSPTELALLLESNSVLKVLESVSKRQADVLVSYDQTKALSAVLDMHLQHIRFVIQYNRQATKVRKWRSTIWRNNDWEPLHSHSTSFISPSIDESPDD